MKSTIVFVFALASMLVVSGCITDPAPDVGDSGDADPDPVAGDGGNATDPGDTAPAALNATITASNVSGGSPLDVAFTLTSESAYASYLDWTFDADGDGTAEETGYGLPASANFTFVDAGDYTAKLTVTDPDAATATATLNITVSEPPAVDLPDPIVFSGTATGAILTEQLVHEFNLTVPVQNITVTFTVGDTGFDYDFYLTNPDDKEFSAAAENDPTGTVAPKAEPPIVVDDAADLVLGTWVLKVDPFLAVEGDYTATVTFN